MQRKMTRLSEWHASLLASGPSIGVDMPRSDMSSHWTFSKLSTQIRSCPNFELDCSPVPLVTGDGAHGVCRNRTRRIRTHAFQSLTGGSSCNWVQPKPQSSLYIADKNIQTKTHVTVTSAIRGGGNALLSTWEQTVRACQRNGEQLRA